MTVDMAGDYADTGDDCNNDLLLFPGGILRNSQQLNSHDENEVALHHSASTAGSGTGVGAENSTSGNGSNGNGRGGIGTPLLNGENIVLLSYSNETTPSGMAMAADQLNGDDDYHHHERGILVGGGEMTGIQQRLREKQERDMINVLESKNNNTDNYQQPAEKLEDADVQDMTLSPNSYIGDLESNGIDVASSPPPESVHSGLLTSLSPPPLSTKSVGGGGAGFGPYYAPPTTSGSVGLFSRGEQHPASVASGGVGSVAVSGGAGAGGNYAASSKEKWRPPLPPRWAVAGGSGTHQSTAGLTLSHQAGMVAPSPSQPQPQQQQTRAVDVVPTHPPLPKQIGQLHHRRVLSTGDASLLSNLTDPDSIPDLGEENSPTQAAAMERAFCPVVLPQSNSLSAKPLPMNPPHRRGVSWAAFGGSEGGGGDGDAWLSSSHSLNRYRSEEEAAFDTLGILQPILQDGDGDEDICKLLMQPVLGDESDMAVTQSAIIGGVGSAFECANSAALGMDATVPPSPLPPPPPPSSPPEKVIRKLEGESTHQSISNKRERNISQFEYEAEMAILEALGEHQNATSNIGVNSINEEDSSHIEPDFQSWISPDSEEGLRLDQHRESPLSRPGMPSRTGDASIFEDSAWSSEYDARGRIDGTLPEERDSKLVGIEMNVNYDIPTVATVQPQMPTPHIQTMADKESDSPRPILKSREGANEINVPTDVSDSTGLRHRKIKSIAAKSMADELAQLAALHGGVTKTDVPVLTKDGGIDNLLAGVVSLAQQVEGKHQSQDHSKTTTENANGGVGSKGEEDAPGDEETGDANQILRGDTVRDLRASEWSSRSSLGRQGSEKLYYLRGWYRELIKPKLPAFWKGATHSICFVMLPLLTVAFILYYAAGNPMAGGSTVEAIMDATEGSDYEYASWQVTTNVGSTVQIVCRYKLTHSHPCLFRPISSKISGVGGYYSLCDKLLYWRTLELWKCSPSTSWRFALQSFLRRLEHSQHLCSLRQEVGLTY
jgi:hypothetical protein